MLGIAGCCLIGLLGSIPAIILAIMAKKEIDANPSQAGRGMATTGLVLGIIGVVIGVIGIILLIIWGLAFVALVMGDLDEYCEDNPEHELCDGTDGSAAAIGAAPLGAAPLGLVAWPRRPSLRRGPPWHGSHATVG